MIESSIKDIIENYYEFFSYKKNVIGIALGYKYTNNINTNIPSIQILVNRKVPSNKMYKFDIIPKSFLGIKTDVVESGDFNMPSDIDDLEDGPVLTNRVRPLQAGYSIGPAKVKHTGTLGCIVFDNKNEAPHILSNNHILANFNKLPIKSTIVQPSIKDSHLSSFNAVAKLSKIIPLNYKTSNSDTVSTNDVDCAIAKIKSNIKYTTNIYKIGPVLRDTKAELGLFVQKSGRTTGHTIGQITSINASFTLGGGSAKGVPCNFRNQIIATKMCEPGDSGSLVVDFSNRAVGIILGSSTFLTYINPIDYILKNLNIHFK